MVQALHDAMENQVWCSDVTSWSDKQAQALQDAMENQVRCSDVTSWSLNLVMSELAMYHAYCIVEALHEKPNHCVFK